MANKQKNPFCPWEMVHFLVNGATQLLKLKKKGITLIKNRARGPPSLLYNGYRVFSRGKAAAA
jgi:hypothetical protein